MNVILLTLTLFTSLFFTSASAVAQEPAPDAPPAPEATVDLFGGESSGLLQEAAEEVVEVVADYGPGPAAFEISPEEAYKRSLLYTSGSRYLLQRSLEVLLENEIERRRAAGIYVGDVDLSKEDIDAEVQKRVDTVMAQDPSADFWAQVRAQGFTEETYRAELRRNVQAQRMFFPLDPEDWPVEQLKEILGRNWPDYLEKDHATLLEKKKNGEFQPLNDQILNQFLMPNVWNYLMTNETVLYPSDGLEEGVAMRIGDKNLMTDELLKVVDPIISEADRQLAQQFVDNMNLLRASLTASGKWMNYDSFRRAFAEEEAMYEGTIIPHSMMVMDFLGFPSMEIYRQYFLAKKSFAATLPEKTLEDGSENPDFRALAEQQMESRGEFYKGSKVKADVILLSARDKRTGQFPLKGDPFGSAAERADEVRDVLMSGEDFLETLVEYSDYPETVQNSNASMPQPNRGRLPMQTRNDMRGFLGESDFSDFLYGYSLADDIFFYSEEGAIYGPVKSPLGYSFYRLDSRSPAGKVLQYGEDERDTFIVEDDLVTTQFLAFLASLRS